MNSLTSLCKPASTILIISVAGILYHFLTGRITVMIWWLLVGIFGAGVFQTLCNGGLEPIAWTLMLIPVLIVCFFLAVAIFSSSVRINTQRKVSCYEEQCEEQCEDSTCVVPCDCDTGSHQS